MREWKEGKGGVKISISPAFVRKLEDIRVGNSLSRKQFNDEYGLGTSTYNVWKHWLTNKLVDSIVVIRICQQLCRKQGLQIDQLGLPDTTVEFLRRVRAGNEPAWQGNEVAAGVTDDDSKDPLLLTIDIKLRPDEQDVLEKLKADVMALVPKYAKHFISFGFRPGSLILRLQLTPENAHHLIEAAEAGEFAFAGYQGYRVIPQVDASELSLKQRLPILAEFARRIDRYHALDVSYSEISLGRMYLTHLDSVIIYSDSSDSNQLTVGAADNIELETIHAVDRINGLTIPPERFIPNEIRALGGLLVRILNTASTRNSASDLPWWQQLSNEAVVALANVENVDQLRSIIMMALDLDPRRQFPTSGEFANAIEALLRGEFTQYSCDARRKQLLAWRAGIAFGKLERQSKLLQEAVSATTFTGDGGMGIHVLTLARNVADNLIDVRRFLIDLNGSAGSREVFEIAEKVTLVSQWIASVEIAALKDAWLVEWRKQLLEHQSVAWSIADRIAGEVFRIALDADALVQNERVEVQWKRSAAIDEPMQMISDRIQSAAQASRHYSDFQVRVAILNREMVRYFRWSEIGEAEFTLPKDMLDWDHRSDLNLFEGIPTSPWHWSQR